MKPSYPSSSSTYQKGLNAYFMPAVRDDRIMNQSELMIDNSQILNDSISQTQGSRVLSKLEPKTLKSNVFKNSELKFVISKVPRCSKVKVKSYPRQNINGKSLE